MIQPPPALIRLVMDLRQGGVSDPMVLNAIERIDRAHFLPAALADQAYANVALPIGQGQFASPPLLLALIAEAAQIQKNHKLLEIGTGSGYQTAILAQLARRVYSVEIVAEFMTASQRLFNRLGISNVSLQKGDGKLGWAQQAPFDRILISAAISAVPDALFQQLRPDGLLLAPIIMPDGAQFIFKFHHPQSGIEPERLWPSQLAALA